MIDGERERERSTRRRRICLVSACAFGGTDSLGLEEILQWSSLGRGGSHNTILAGFLSPGRGDSFTPSFAGLKQLLFSWFGCSNDFQCPMSYCLFVVWRFG
uniref:Uncharacterized protein n=1 Tax=Brassica oleracea TaxID=3712 RepID=A0A3P6GAX5_BRAOL|nr:unnamed protein product [Brassica oleracea]